MSGECLSPLEFAKKQRSHVLFVMSDATADQDADFLRWYRLSCRDAVSAIQNVISARHYQQHELDVTLGLHARLPYRYLGIYEISVDGAPAAASIIEQIERLYRAQPAARAPATWLYYPVSEKVGRPPEAMPSMLTLAFANAIPGQEAEFREWYATRHTRHALNVPALVSGQCFERTLFQSAGALEARFAMIAVYEQEGSAESMIASFNSLPASTFHFPAMDLSRFAESVYRPV
jgi:hypothetical protein